MILQRQQVAIRLLGYFQHEREAQETRLALQRSLDRAILDARESECRGKENPFWADQGLEAGWQEQQAVLLVGKGQLAR